MKLMIICLLRQVRRYRPATELAGMAPAGSGVLAGEASRAGRMPAMAKPVDEEGPAEAKSGVCLPGRHILVMPPSPLQRRTTELASARDRPASGRGGGS